MDRFLDLMKSKRMTLVMSLPANDVELARAALDGGAEVLKVHINVEHRASGTHFGTLEEERHALEGILRAAGTVPVGIVPGGAPTIQTREIEMLRDMGFDFISSYAHHISPAALKVPGIDKILAPDYSYTVHELDALALLPTEMIEASIIEPNGYGQGLSVRDLARYLDLCRRVKKPVLVPTQRAIKPEELGSLQEAGVSGIMLGAVVAGRDAESIRRTVEQFMLAIQAL